VQDAEDADCDEEMLDEGAVQPQAQQVAPLVVLQQSKVISSAFLFA
jgi:hypothetical protein